MPTTDKATSAGDQGAASTRVPQDSTELHPAWRAFVHYCQRLRFGEIERLSIQDGLPVLAELTTKKVKFT